jgi:hypothetical protein
MVVWARVGDTQEARGFLVRSDAPGISIKRTWDHLGLRASRSDDVLFAGTPAIPTVGILHGCLKTRTLYDEATAWSHRLNLPQSSVAA